MLTLTTHPWISSSWNWRRSLLKCSPCHTHTHPHMHRHTDFWALRIMHENSETNTLHRNILNQAGLEREWITLSLVAFVGGVWIFFPLQVLQLLPTAQRYALYLIGQSELYQCIWPCNRPVQRVSRLTPAHPRSCTVKQYSRWTDGWTYISNCVTNI